MCGPSDRHKTLKSELQRSSLRYEEFIVVCGLDPSHGGGAALILGVVLVMFHSHKPNLLTASAALVDEGPCRAWMELVRLAQLRSFGSEVAPRKSCPGQFLDLHMYQLSPASAVRQGLGDRSIAMRDWFCDRRAHSGVLVREATRKRGSRRARLKITYPVAIDTNYEIWRAFNNQAWPAQYLIDGEKGEFAITTSGKAIMARSSA